MKNPPKTFAAPSPTTSGLMTAREVAALLAISERSVWRAAAAGDLPKPVAIRGASRWIRLEIESVIADAAARRG